MTLDPLTLFTALSDETRLRLLLLLTTEQELCVCELTHALEQPQPKISRHLALLRENEIVVDRREGLWVHYRINPDLPAWAREVLGKTATHNGGKAPFVKDRRAIRRAPNRPPSRCCA
ncbi:transcriptional regulator [Sulfurifustis variabilis]|uniref:Transcriptional regulator n=1 Tax=Sulfurifustis variabilis TaxID=1675686 RepID=A0A1B4V0K5_9GAMM|nr:metalloregulator ArsR/SmtB family transcription factor [Sulfurifustis variabilis]BAU46986.1 transcriptional regulator [Sulfurifustis variabilis]